MYRILEFRGKLSFSTITDPGIDIRDSYHRKWKHFLDTIFFPTLQRVFTPADKVALPQPQPFPILKSGPQTVEDEIMGRGTVSTSFYSLVRSAKCWQETELKDSLLELLKLWSEHNMGGRFPPIMERIGWAAGNMWHRPDAPVHQFEKHPLPAKGLGKLGFKEEAAGKVRVFAMVDPFTQWVMRPIHLAIFTILRGIPMDGTFNQTKPVEALRGLSPKDRWYYSIDLSAATDRLPISLQIPVMEGVFSWARFPNASRAAHLWATLLTGRAYTVKYNPEFGFDLPDDLPSSVTYSVGQPMGALSSWAMLALTHHAIVQWAAHRAKRRHPKASIPIAFRDYAVLGDDIVILNKYVAKEYLRVLKEIGVKAGLAKSIVSKGAFYLEFAKKFFVPQGRADMLPLKEVIATLSSTLLICEFVKQHSLTIGQILSVLGYGYKAKSRATSALYWHLNKRLRTLLIWFRSPKGAYPLPCREWIRSSGFNSLWEVSDDHIAWQYIWEALMVEVQILMNRYYDAAEKFRKQAESAGALRPEEDMRVKGIPISRHPPYLRKALVRDDAINQYVAEPVPFSTLVAPIDFDVDETAGGWTDARAFNERYGLVDTIHHPVVVMPESLIKADLFEQVFAINDESLTDKLFSTKCEELTQWIFDFDKLAQDIPTSYWPQIRAGEKPMREFIQTAKIHDIFTTVFRAFKLNPRSISGIARDCSGNTPYPDLNQSLSSYSPLPVELSLVPIREPLFGDIMVDALRRLKQGWVVTRVEQSPVYFTSRSFVIDDWSGVVKVLRFIQDMIILASLVWLVPLYEGPAVEGIPLESHDSYVALGILSAMVVLLLIALWYLNLSYTDFELSAIDLLSRQSQQISEHEVRLIRMIAEREDLEDIIRGLESALGS
jgi:hypothetical protein